MWNDLRPGKLLRIDSDHVGSDWLSVSENVFGHGGRRDSSVRVVNILDICNIRDVRNIGDISNVRDVHNA
jgi:hypothetical protein